MELDPAQIVLLERGGLLHDVGKIGVPARILDHPGELSDEEFAVMKQHPVIGVRILEPIEAFRPALPIVRSHHERWDGTGYPDGLRGREIPRLARILAVADVFDAMVSTRPYRAAIPQEVVAASIIDRAGLHFDAEVVEAFARLMERGWDHATGALLEVDRAV
jgi:HD-GYP domain-containing protein (c-di-GMP phosphodiesterase class II)